MNKIKISKKDLGEYKYTSSRSAKIRLFWLSILKEIPQHLKDEVRSKQTDLVKVGQSNYVFQTKDGTEDLNMFLEQFEIELEDLEYDTAMQSMSFY